MSTMLHEMAAVIADPIGAGPQVDGEDDAHFIIDMFYIAADPPQDVAVNAAPSTH